VLELMLGITTPPAESALSPPRFGRGPLCATWRTSAMRSVQRYLARRSGSKPRLARALPVRSDASGEVGVF